MLRFPASTAVLGLLSLLFLSHVVDADEELSYIYYDNQEFLANASNVLKISWPEVKGALEHPDHEDTATYTGFDWTQPFPGSSIDGFKIHLRIANDVPWPETAAHNQSTEVSALTFGIPDAMMNAAKGLPKPMDASWYVCQHYFVSSLPDPTAPMDHDCGFLSTQCRADLDSSLTDRWFQEDPDVACSAFSLDAVPVSCQGSLGLIRADVLAWGSDSFEDDFTAKFLTVDEVNQATWMLGTGFVEAGNTTAYYEASNRTFIVGTVFGYSATVEESKRQTPKLSLSCLRSEWIQPPPPNTTISSTVAPIAYPASTSTEPAVNTVASTTVAPSTTNVATGPSCVSGTISPNRINGDFQELCGFSCSFNYCPPTACQCLEYSDTPKPVPANNGKAGCALEDAADDDYQHLCNFACSHGTCPEAACRYC
ncbi:hypothetical protein LY78DRAFT_675806 [Colletotrichum sublineola]|uniref:Uncharacterized protein n=1 Tax=Colletotrichum sublineola TaxID=1173701 RepID=A0A066XBL8_COLSU|nr:hypothetical protein LY78DRAFT_675806 [Colletotrichum sublineola]KDN63131.1 hypothetical protein CSUB01_00205 [Colletotrichum sublineola]